MKGRQGQRVRLYVRGTILGYKRSKSNQYENTSLLQIEGVNTKEEVGWYAGKRIAYVYKAKTKSSDSTIRCIWGKVTRPHGNSGVVRAKFRSNLPPTSMGKKVRVFMRVPDESDAEITTGEMEIGRLVRTQTQPGWATTARGGRRRPLALALGLSSHRPPPPSVRTVSIPFSDLKERDRDLSGKIEEGLGPNGLGIISIADVPGFPVLRKTLLRLAPIVANLPEDVKKELEDPDSRFNFGWSHGKEKLESGKLDTFKGSFYANPILDVPTTDDVLVRRYPSYCRTNIWPASHLPELEIAFKALGKLMLEVGLMLAHHCDHYVMQQGVGPYDGESLEQTIASSRCHKGRLLYYLPRQFSKQEEGGSVSSWCGWHTDHGSLTGLTCALFTRNSMEILCPDSAAGLYIRTRDDKVVKVTFEENELAYQVGETTEILSRGRLCATPHCVKAPSSENASNVDRSTFAMFMQPDWDEKLKFPSEIPYHQELIPPNGTLTFGEYSERLNHTTENEGKATGEIQIGAAEARGPDPSERKNGWGEGTPGTWPPTTAMAGSESQRVGRALSSPWSPRAVQARCSLLTSEIRFSMAAAATPVQRDLAEIAGSVGEGRDRGGGEEEEGGDADCRAASGSSCAASGDGITNETACFL
uniref:Fe2OG dioxygenase domain-containing protein n=2 Tax=Oryza punctata TaxID=4537 RepID=A0A0E0L5I5_ORYPU